MAKSKDSTTAIILGKTPTYIFFGDSSITLVPTSKKKEPIARQDSIQITAALYNNISSLPDDDPPGFSQYYLWISIPTNKINGIPSDTTGWGNVVWCRNLYFTPTLNASALNYVPLDSLKSEHHANRLDLFQYAYFTVPAELNLVTYIDHKDTLDHFHWYFYLLGGMMFTKDTSYSSGSSHIITSGFWGTGISWKSKNISSAFTFEGGLSIFDIIPITNSLDVDLNIQNRNLADTALASNATKPLFGDTEWFSKLEAFIYYSLNNNSSAYLHFNYTRDLASYFSKRNYTNSYFQIQFGVSFNVLNFLNSILGNGGKGGNPSVPRGG
jgi:hypothetical protein